MSKIALAKKRLEKAQKLYDKAVAKQLMVHLEFENAQDNLDEAEDDLMLLQEFGGAD